MRCTLLSSDTDWHWSFFWQLIQARPTMRLAPLPEELQRLKHIQNHHHHHQYQHKDWGPHILDNFYTGEQESRRAGEQWQWLWSVQSEPGHSSQPASQTEHSVPGAVTEEDQGGGGGGLRGGGGHLGQASQEELPDHGTLWAIGSGWRYQNWLNNNKHYF